MLTERRSVTSSYHGIKISGSQHSFLTEMAICIVKRSTKGMGYRFVSECNNAEESHTCQLFHFFLPYLQHHMPNSLLRSRNLATIRWWCDVTTTSPLYISLQKLWTWDVQVLSAWQKEKIIFVSRVGLVRRIHKKL